MKAREFLVEKNLAKAGTRGKFTTKALEALKEAIASGTTFEDWDANGRVVQARTKKRTVVLTPSLLAAAATSRKNEFNAMRVVDAQGIELVIEFCANSHSLSTCTCETIKAPDYLRAVSFELIKR